MKERCINMNHGRLQPAVNFCPTCGESFSRTLPSKRCDNTTHATDRKARAMFCSCCGLKLASR